MNILSVIWLILVRESLIYHMFITQLRKTLQEWHSFISYLAGSLLILKKFPEQILAMGGVNNKILP